MNNVSGGAFWHTPLDELERQLGASSNGLSSTEATARLLRYGANTLDSRRKLFISAQGSEPLPKSPGPNSSRCSRDIGIYRRHRQLDHHLDNGAAKRPAR